MITLDNIQQALSDDRHLGFGYAEASLLSDSRRERLDMSVTVVANELGLDSETFFHWTNSKHGRWLVDGVYGRREPASQAIVRYYLNEGTVAEALDGVEFDYGKLTDAELAHRLDVAATDDDDVLPYALNEVCARANIDPNETEQGLTPAASAAVDAWVAKALQLTATTTRRQEN